MPQGTYSDFSLESIKVVYYCETNFSPLHPPGEYSGLLVTGICKNLFFFSSKLVLFWLKNFVVTFWGEIFLVRTFFGGGEGALTTLSESQGSQIMSTISRQSRIPVTKIPEIPPPPPHHHHHFVLHLSLDYNFLQTATINLSLIYCLANPEYQMLLAKLKYTDWENSAEIYHTLRFLFSFFFSHIYNF